MGAGVESSSDPIEEMSAEDGRDSDVCCVGRGCNVGLIVGLAVGAGVGAKEEAAQEVTT